MPVKKNTIKEISKRNEPIVVLGNWKMHLGADQSAQLAKKLLSSARKYQDAVHTVVFPSFPALDRVARTIKGGAISLGAQNMFWENDGNDTGEVSPLQLQELSCTWVILGHSERRQKLAESDDMIERKLAVALRTELQPVLCVGETMAERQQERGLLRVTHQLESALRYVQPQKEQVITIAYEPIWSISPGKPCEPADADGMARDIRQVLIDRYGVAAAYRHFRLLYGGSVDPDNIADYLKLEEISGVLVGSASLKFSSFRAMLEQAAKVRRQPRKKLSS